MDGGKPEKNPSVITWLKYHDPELYEAIEDQNIGGILKPKFGTTMTFLYPADKACRDDIIAKLNGDEASLGVNYVQAHVIRDLLSDPSEWLEKKSNIPNALGQKVEVSDKSSNKEVILSNGAVLTLNKSFKSRDDNIAVWDYKHKSPMPVDGKPAEFVKRAPREIDSAKKRKIAAGGSGLPMFPRKAILAKRLQDQAVCLLKDGWQALQESNPFTAAMVSLVDYVKHKHSDSLSELNMLCEPNSISAFYAIVMPYSDSSFFSNDIITSWLKETRGICLVPNPNGEWATHVNSLRSLGQNLHEELMDNRSSGVKGKGIIGIGAGIYRKFGANSALRLRGDEMRFVIAIALAKREELKPKDLGDLFLDLELIYSKGSEPFFLINNSGSDPVFLETVYVFMSSRCFASIPVPVGGSNKISFSTVMNSGVQVDPSDDLISDDDHYLTINTTNPDSEFITGFKKLLADMPQEMKQSFLSQLQV